MPKKRLITVNNFEKYQHYKDRNPPWIKLYFSLLSNYEFASLRDSAKWHLVGLFLLAGRTNNRIPHDLTWIKQELKITDNIDLKELKSSGFINFSASKTPEKMEHFEKDSTLILSSSNSSTSSTSSKYYNILEGKKFEEFWKNYPRKTKPNKQGTIRQWNMIIRDGESDAEQLVQCCNNYASTVNGKEDKFIMHPKTFLGADRRYKDFLDVAAKEPDYRGGDEHEIYG